MLRTRVITAVAILLVLVGMLFFASALVWSLFVLADRARRLLGMVAHVRACRRGAGVFLFLSGAAGACFWLLYARGAEWPFIAAASTAFIVAAVFWIVAAPLWLAKKARPGPSACALAGWLVVWPTWFAFVVLRDASPWLLLAIAALVWVADIAAYFAGPALRQAQARSRDQPGQDLGRRVGALAGVVLYGIVLSWLAHAYPTPFSSLSAARLGVPGHRRHARRSRR